METQAISTSPVLTNEMPRAELRRGGKDAPVTTVPHLVQLDGLRAFSVAGVLVFHFLPAVANVLQLGPIAVRLFFVLSGFLITMILLRCKELLEEGGQGVWYTLRQFYTRRFLRIFPAFYLALGLAWALDVRAVRNALAWHASYLSNVYFALCGKWDSATSHLWSLSVEEQFYLFFPLVILLVPRKYLLKTLAGMALVGPLFRLAGALGGSNLLYPFILPFGCLDTLGAGALLALSFETGAGHRLARAGSTVGGPLLTTVVVFDYVGLASVFVSVMLDVAVALVSLWLIVRAAEGFGGLAGRVLEWRPVVYVGTISYGIYLYHLFVRAVLPRAYVEALPEWGGLGPFVIWTACSVAFAAMSWEFFERPLNGLKRFFPYKRAARDERPAPAACASPVDNTL